MSSRQSEVASADERFTFEPDWTFSIALGLPSLDGQGYNRFFANALPE